MKCAGLRELNCNHSAEGRTGDKATIIDKVLHILYTCVRCLLFSFKINRIIMLDLDKLENKLDNALKNETKKSLIKFFKNIRKNGIIHRANKTTKKL